MNGNVTKIHPFTCYFCNKLIENETENGHMTSCGSVLEPCINKCGSYIQRSMKSRHMQECQNKKMQTLPRLVKQQNFEQPYPINAFSPPTSVSYSNYGKSISPFENQSFRSLSNDVARFSSKLATLEQTIMQVHQNLNHIKGKQDNMQAQQNTQIQINSNFDKMLYQNQILMESKRTIEIQLNNLRKDVNFIAKSNTDFQQKWHDAESKFSLLQKIQTDLNLQNENFLKEQLFNRETHIDLRTKLQKFEDFYTQENATISALWTDTNATINNLTKDVLNLNKNLEEHKLKYNTVVFDLRAVTQISSENAEKLEIQEREMKEIRKKFSQLKLDMEILEDGQSLKGLFKPGGIIWKLTDFSLKMESSKSNDLLLKSPIFYTHQYGYKIRLIVYLNGIKKWKGRHTIACLHVLKGEYDLMLKWPCYIDGHVIIRDIHDYDNQKNISKYITAKRQCGDEENEEPQESSSQYIFIPHSTMLKQNYIKDETLFIEIKINQPRKIKEETSL